MWLIIMNRLRIKCQFSQWKGWIVYKVEQWNSIALLWNGFLSTDRFISKLSHYTTSLSEMIGYYAQVWIYQETSIHKSQTRRCTWYKDKRQYTWNRWPFQPALSETIQYTSSADWCFIILIILLNKVSIVGIIVWQRVVCRIWVAESSELIWSTMSKNSWISQKAWPAFWISQL